VGERGDAAPGAAADVILDDSDDQGRRKALRRAFVLHENSFTFDDLATGSSLYDGADALKSILLTETQPPVSQGLRTKTLSASNLGHPPMAIILIAVVLAVITGLTKLFRKTNIANDVAGALHPIVGRFGPDTIELFTFVTLQRLARALPNDFRVAALEDHIRRPRSQSCKALQPLPLDREDPPVNAVRIRPRLSRAKNFESDSFFHG